MTSRFSSCVNVGDSPVVPTATRPVIPPAICASINFSSAAKSTSPLRNGVTSAVKVPRNISSNVDRTLERKLSRSRQRHVSELAPCSLEIHAQFAAAADNDGDWPIDLFSRGKNQRARNNPRAASKCFIFDPAFVGADGNLPRTTFLDEIYVRPGRRKQFVTSNRAASPVNVHHVHASNRHDHVRHAAVDIMHPRVFTLELELHIELQIFGLAHVQRDQVAM